MAEQTIPVTILTGFLGSGKTTLLQRILTDPEAPNYGVLVNDFGAINIDADLVTEVNDDGVVALQNGCVCCTIRDDLVEALGTMITRTPAPERLIVEASGISRPLQIAEALEDKTLAGRLLLDGTFCLVDCGEFLGLDFAATELAMDQVSGSDLAILNKTDLASEAEIEAIEVRLKGAQPRLKTLRTTEARVPLDLIGGLEPVGHEAGCDPVRCSCGNDHGHEHHHHHHDHADAFAGFSWQEDVAVDLSALRQALRRLPEGLLRGKGILRGCDGRRIRFDLVGKRLTVRAEDGPLPALSSAVFIGRTGSFSAEELGALLTDCVGETV